MMIIPEVANIVKKLENVKKKIPSKKKSFLPLRSDNLPKLIKVTAFTNKYIIGIHWTTSNEVPKSLEIDGIAIFTILPSKEAINTPMVVITNTFHLYSTITIEPDLNFYIAKPLID